MIHRGSNRQTFNWRLWTAAAVVLAAPAVSAQGVIKGDPGQPIGGRGGSQARTGTRR
mgnify:CR=1 FL=1